MTRAEAIEAINARQNKANHSTNISKADIQAEMKKEAKTMTYTDRDVIISSMIQGIMKHGTRDIHYNLIDSSEYIQRCLCELPADDPIRNIADKWLTLRPSKFNRWHARRGYGQATKKLLDFAAADRNAAATDEPAQTESKEEEKKMDSTTNEAKKELLSINPHALQGLHSMIGYDFQQPHTIVHIEGRFTVNSALKAIGGANRENVVALLAMDHGRSYLDRLNLVTVDSAGRIDIDHKGGYKFGLDSVCMKGTFEDIRKSDRAECFIICQRSEYVKKPQGKPFDTSARYEYTPGKDSKCGDGHGMNWIDRITVRALDGSNADHEVTKDGHQYHFSTVVYHRPNESRPQSHLEIIDKSGYLLPERRADLLRRADQLRKERAKSAYQATDNAAKVEELRAMVEAKKAEFAAAIASATDSEALRTAAHELYFKFMLTMSEFERFADKTARRDYVSIEAAENAYTAIKSKLEKEDC